jgi:hypothetical protein
MFAPPLPGSEQDSYRIHCPRLGGRHINHHFELEFCDHASVTAAVATRNRRRSLPSLASIGIRSRRSFLRGSDATTGCASTEQIRCETRNN